MKWHLILKIACNSKGLKMMLKTWIKDAGIKDLGVFFHIEKNDNLMSWSNHFKEVTIKSYMSGYRKLNNINPIYNLMIKMCDNLINMIIVKIEFK